MLEEKKKIILDKINNRNFNLTSEEKYVRDNPYKSDCGQQAFLILQ